MRSYIGLFIVSLAAIMYEFLLMRIFSITMFYHFAFMVISICMLGMTIGSVIVYLAPRFFNKQNLMVFLSVGSLVFGLSIAIGLIFCCQLGHILDILKLSGGARVWSYLPCVYLFAGLPFVLSGIVICLALTKLPKSIGRLYAADLFGAAFGCILLILMLNFIDGVSVGLFIAVMASAAAFFFVDSYQSTTINKLAIIITLTLTLLGMANAIGANNNQPLIKISEMFSDVYNVPDKERLYEKWNSFSRVLVHGDPSILRRPMAWGLSAKWPQEKKVSELTVTIDSGADTPMTRFHGDLNELEHLQYDVINAAHLIRSNANVLVIGVGGGRDILSALFYHQKHILGVEINGRILEALRNQFGDYTGHLDHYPQVQLVNDEARSFIARSSQQFDIIQISLIDTFAATASGAFAFTENSLYTLEAWKSMVEHLSPKGVLSVSRWYYKKLPGEIYRSLTLATTTLRSFGTEDPRQNIIIIANKDGGYGGRIDWNVGNLIISKQAFSNEDLNTLEKYAEEKGFQIVLSPRTATDINLVNIVSTKNLETLTNSLPINILPTTDDNPFFFHTAKSQSLFNSHVEQSREYFAVVILQCLLTIILLLSLCFIFIPLFIAGDTQIIKSGIPFLFYFCGIGLGFMFIEVSQMQRLIIFLGHPVYSLSVVLFTLLLSGGAGSYAISVIGKYRELNKPVLLLGLLLVSLVIFGCLTPSMITYFRSFSTFVRIIVSVIILTPLGFFMGMAFPLGMQLSQKSLESLTPWLWGVNGAASVCASVLALVISLNWGLSATFWTGFMCYLLAFLAMRLINKSSIRIESAR